MIREWDIKRTTFSLADFLSWQRTGSLELSPSFQRRSVWTKAQKSYFVDTVYRGLPVPIIFMRERTDVETLSTIREIVDGQQRLRTLLSFVDLQSLRGTNERDQFVVQKKHNPDIAGRQFSSLSQHEKARILSYQFSVHALPSDTSDSEVLSIFARMNSTGSKLNDQELRNAEFFGEFKIASYDAALENLARWRNWGIFSEQDIARMEEVEFTSILFITLIIGLFERTQGNINKYYEQYDDVFQQKESVVRKFHSVMETIENTFGDSITTSVFKNSNMFFQLFYLINRLTDEGKPINRPRMRAILSAGDNIARRDIPDPMKVALASRFNRLSNQRMVADYLYDHAAK